MEIVYSVNLVPIRLTDERWSHIVNSHEDMANYHDDCLKVIEQPDFVLQGASGSLRAVKSFGRNRYLMVTYREVTKSDGFIITAYFVRRINRGDIIWRR